MYAMEDRLNYNYNYYNTNSNSNRNSNDNVNMRNNGTIINDDKNRLQFYEKPCKTCYK